MRKSFHDPTLKFYLGDIRDLGSVKQAMTGVDFVFHAAALKQVPSCEFYPLEAVKTNIMGTDNVIEAALDRGVKRVICLSTDKAVYPINAMGISKAMMEKLMVAKAWLLAETNSVVCGTRYGNVMTSRGSVIPRLRVQRVRSRHADASLRATVQRDLRVRVRGRDRISSAAAGAVPRRRSRAGKPM